MTRPRAAFDIQESWAEGCLRLSLTGDLDLASAPVLENRVVSLRANRRPVQLDLSKLDFIDSTGVRLLIQLVGDARLKHWPFRIEPDVSPEVMRIFRLVRLDRFVG